MNRTSANTMSAASRFAMALLATLTTTIANAESAAWTRFSTPGGRFVVDMPGQPTFSSNAHWSLAGTVRSHEYAVDDGQARYSANLYPLPCLAVALTARATLLGRAIRAFLDDNGANAARVANIEHRGISGKRVLYELPPLGGRPALSGKAHVFLMGCRVYVFDAHAPKTDGPVRLDRFLTSVRFDPRTEITTR